MSARQLIVTLGLLWAAFAIITFNVPTNQVFHCLNAIVVSAGLITIAAYAPGLRDVWRSRSKGLSDGQLLVLGVVVNWSGFTVRLARWYVTDAVPIAGGTAAWAYNVGLWISVCGAALLVGALAISEPPWSSKRVLAHAAAFLALTVMLLQFDLSVFEDH